MEEEAVDRVMHRCNLNEPEKSTRMNEEEEKEKGREKGTAIPAENRAGQ